MTATTERDLIAKWNETAITIISDYIDVKSAAIPGTEERNGWKFRAIAATRRKLEAMTAEGTYAWAVDDSLAKHTPPIDPNYALRTQLRAFDIGVPTHQLMIMLSSADWIRPTTVPLDASAHTVRMDGIAGLVPMKDTIDIDPDKAVGISDIFDGVDPFGTIQSMMTTILQDAYRPGDLLALTGPSRRKSSTIGKVYLEAVRKAFGSDAQKYLDCACCRNFLFHIGSLVALRRDDDRKVRVHSLLWDLDAAGFDRGEVHPALQRFFDTMRDHAVRRPPRTLLSGDDLASMPVISEYNNDTGNFTVGHPHEGLDHDGNPFPHLYIVLNKSMLTKYDLSACGGGGTYGDLINHVTSIAKEQWMDPDHITAVISRLTGRASLEKFVTTDGLFWWEDLVRYLRSKPKDLWLEILVRLSEVANPTVLSLRTKLTGALLRESYTTHDSEKSAVMDKAFRAFFKRADPSDYMRASKEASADEMARLGKMLREEGYLTAFERRPASVADLDQYFTPSYSAPQDATEVVDNTSAEAVLSKLSRVDAAGDTVDPLVATRGVSVESLSYREFSEKYDGQIDRLWSTPRPVPNFIHMTTAVHADAKPIYKWDNGNLPIAWYYLDPRKVSFPNSAYGVDKSTVEVERIYKLDLGEHATPKVIIILKGAHAIQAAVESSVMIFSQALKPELSSRADFRRAVETMSSAMAQDQSKVNYLQSAAGYSLAASSTDCMPVTLIARLKSGVYVRVNLIKA